jgi:hypothetical protein
MEQQLTHWKKLTNPDYLGAYELMDGSEKGKDMVVTIDRVVRQMITGADGKKEECTVCYLKECKPMILNATNQKTIQKLFNSPFIEKWSGGRMTLYVAKVKAFGDVVDALRIRSTVPPLPQLPELTPIHEKWNGAKQAIADGKTTIEAIRKAFTLTAANEALILAK